MIMKMKNSTMIGEKPNFSLAYSKANEILVKSSVIDTFPFSPFALVKEQTPIVCRSYEKAQKYGVDIREFGSESAVIMNYKGMSIIFYDRSKPISHVKFSILHELGHAVNHHDFAIKDEATYAHYEIETNFFSAQLLMPEQILREVMKRGTKLTSLFLVQHFDVSMEAAKKRIATLAKTNVEWRSREEKEFDDIILLKYKSFIDSISPMPIAFYDFEKEDERQRERESWY